MKVACADEPNDAYWMTVQAQYNLMVGPHSGASVCVCVSQLHRVVYLTANKSMKASEDPRYGLPKDEIAVK